MRRLARALAEGRQGPYSGGESQHVQRGAVEDLLVDVATPDGLGQVMPQEARWPRHLQVQPSRGVGDRVVSGMPVGHQNAVPAPLLAQHAGDEGRIVGALDAVEAVVGRHHRPRSGHGHGFEREQVDLAQRPLVDDAVDRGPMVLGVICHEMLGAGGDALRLHARHVRDPELGDEQRVLRVALEVTAGERRPDQVEDRPEHVVDVRPLGLGPDPGGDLRDQFHVPGGPEGRAARRAGGARTLRERHSADAVGPVEGQHLPQANRVDAGGMPGIDAGGQLSAFFDRKRPHQCVKSLDRDLGRDVGRLRHASFSGCGAGRNRTPRPSRWPSPPDAPAKAAPSRESRSED